MDDELVLGHVYEDVARNFERWVEKGFKGELKLRNHQSLKNS